MVELLHTKLFIPRPRKNLVSRPRLVDRLNAGLDQNLALIDAPAGFGKTTLLSEWIPKSPRCVTWLSLDEGDNDPTQFWAYFIASLQELRPDLGANAFALIQSPQAPPIKSILTELINDLAGFPDFFASVLDDYHFIDSQPIHEGLTFLIDHLPDNMHLVITTREDPALPLARLRARDQLTEIRAWDLRFTQEETDSFLRGVMGLDLSRQDMAALEDRTEGWVVGLQLAGLSMQRQANPKAFIEDFSGSHRYILDYLTDEVLQRQPEGIRTFLLHTAILDRLGGPLCDALTGRTDSDKLLAKLEADNLFVIPLDNERRWYRYHHLFADLLRSQLSRSHPELIPELHRRASRWYEVNGDIQTAIDHALQDTDLSQAANLIEQHALPKLFQGQVAVVVGWFDRLPEDILKSAPFLCICKGWALVLMRRGVRWEDTKQAVDSALKALERVEAGEKLRRLVTGHAASIRAFIPLSPTLAGKNPKEQIALAEEAQALLPEGEEAIRSINALNIGVGKKALADMEAASHAFDQVLEYGLAGGNYYAAIYGPINLVECALLVGRLEKALQLCEANIELFNRILPGQFFPPIGALDVMKGLILFEYNRLEEAKRSLTEGLDLVRWTGEYSAYIKGYTALSWLHALQGNRQAALAAVSALDENWPEGHFYTRALRQRFLTDQWPDDPEIMNEAHTWLDQSGIKFAELEAIHHVDAMGEVYFTFYLNAAHTLAHLAKRNPGSFPVDGAQAYLERQQDFAETHGIISWVVAVAIARTLLYQAEEKTPEALKALQVALSAAAPTGLFRTFLDECKALRALIETLISRMADRSVIEYANRLLDAMTCESIKPKTRERSEALLTERELEVLRYLVGGLTYEQIGQRLFLSLNTVQFHVKNIYSKLMVKKRVQAIKVARELKLI